MGKKSKKKKEESEEEEEDDIEDEKEELLDDNLPADPRPPYSHCTDRFLHIDMYGVRPQLEMRGKRKVRSCCGACVSFIAILFIILYTVLKTAYLMKEDGFIGAMIVKMIELQFIFIPYSMAVMDCCSHIGGFGYFIYKFYGYFVKSCNKKIYLRNLIQDAYLAKNNNDFLGISTEEKPKKKDKKKDKKGKKEKEPKGKKGKSKKKA